jgi:hypothetical protein
MNATNNYLFKQIIPKVFILSKNHGVTNPLKHLGPYLCFGN